MTGSPAVEGTATATRAQAMLRLALTPRWLLLLAVLVGLIVAAILLGRWQWDRTQSILAAERAAVSVAVPVQDALGDTDAELPPESIGRPVTAAGEYDPDRQVVVANRSLEGAAGLWIVTGLRLADGTLIPVLRGWTAADDLASRVVPSGPVDVAGILQPDEVFYADAPVTSAEIVAISQQSLEAAWGEEVPPGFIVLAEQRPLAGPAPEPVPPTVQTADVPFPLQNFFYAFQWWIFAAFGIFLYLRWLRIEAGRAAEESTSLSG